MMIFPRIDSVCFQECWTKKKKKNDTHKADADADADVTQKKTRIEDNRLALP